MAGTSDLARSPLARAFAEEWGGSAVMNHDWLYGYQHWMLMYWGGGLLLAVAAATLGYAAWVKRRRSKEEMQVRALLGVSEASDTFDTMRGGRGAGTPVDTLFLVPDISNYTRFVSDPTIDTEDAENVVLSLMSAVIRTVGGNMLLSKIEGDSALFFADAHRCEPMKIGATVGAVFEAFDNRKRNLVTEAEGRPEFAASIDQLDLKIIVHRGIARRFTYRSAVDHFGAEVTLLYKLLKNHIRDDRYILVTDAASDLIALEERFSAETIIENVKHMGLVEATVFRPRFHLKALRPEPVTRRSTRSRGPEIEPPGQPTDQRPNWAASVAATFSPTNLRIVRRSTTQKWNLKMKITTLIATAVIALTTTVASATDYTKGKVTKVDERSGKITVKHEELKNLDMPAMTMVFVAKDDDVRSKLKTGQNIQFVAERIKGKLTIVEVK